MPSTPSLRSTALRPARRSGATRELATRHGEPLRRDFFRPPPAGAQFFKNLPPAAPEKRTRKRQQPSPETARSQNFYGGVFTPGVVYACGERSSPQAYTTPGVKTPPYLVHFFVFFLFAWPLRPPTRSEPSRPVLNSGEQSLCFRFFAALTFHTLRSPRRARKCSFRCRPLWPELCR